MHSCTHASHHGWLLHVDEKRDRQKCDTDEDLQSEPIDQIGADTEAHTGREEANPLLPFSIDEIRQPEETGENPDKQR